MPIDSTPEQVRSTGRSLAPAVAVCAVLFLGGAGCGDGGGGADDRPSSIVVVSPATDTVEVGATLEPPLEVRVTNSRDEPLPGIEVRFDVAIGPGEVAPERVATDGDGHATATFAGAERVGQARVEADVPGTSGAGQAVFTVRVVTPTSTRITAVGGGGQEAETGSQLPRPFQVEVRTPGGEAAGGVPVSWRLAETPGEDLNGGLLVDTVYTDEQGQAENLLTLGGTPGEYAVRAWSPGSPDTVVFAATAVDSLGGGVVLDSVSPRPLLAGQEATLHGSGFPTSAGDAGARVEGTAAEVLSASADSLRIRVPSFAGRCLPARSVGVRAESGGTASNGLLVRMDPAGGFVELQVGEPRTVTLPAGSDCVQLDSAASGRAYRVMAQSASQVSGAVTPMRLVARSGATVGAALTEPVATALRAPDVPAWIMGPEARGLVLRTRLQQRARDELLRQPARGGESGPVARNVAPVAAQQVPDRGDTLRLFMPVAGDLSISCSDTSNVMTTVVREVGDRVAILEDTASPAGGLREEDFRTLLEELDRQVFPVDTSYFGGPSDIDDNGRVLILLTPEVNDLTPLGSEAFIGGFFLSTDLVDSGDTEGEGVQGPDGQICSSSNEAEIVYLATADPFGQFGIAISRQRAIRNTRSVAAHELEHLLSAAQRMIVGGGWITDLESAWLGEGLAHLAEEVAGFAVEGLRTRSELGYDAITEDSESFEAFFLNNFARGGLFMQRPGGTLTITSRDPGGLESLRMRGFGWLFTRWLGDHLGPAGSGGPVAGGREERLFRELSSGGAGHRQGIENVRGAVEEVQGTRPSWEELLGDFGAMLAVEGEASGLPERFTLPTWDLRDVFGGIHAGPRGDTDPFTQAYPLRVEGSGFETGAWDFDVNASGAVYFEFGSQGVSAPFSLSLRSQSGGELPEGARARFTIVRIR